MDTYRTISGPAEGTYTEKRSKFLAFAFPISTIDEAKERLAQCQKQYYDARHACYAYMLGAERDTFRANDAGEPSGTAGRPILGQINSLGLTDIIIIVVRYFGGIKLGTGGLCAAYKTAAAAALANAHTVERVVEATLEISFDYVRLNDVMRIVKDHGPTVVSQQFDTACTMTLRTRRDSEPQLRARLAKVVTLTFRGENTATADNKQ